MSLRFGTDGVRGVANSELTPELTLALGRAAARILGGGAGGEGISERRRLLVGRDTRQSGLMLFAALSAGLTAEGIDVVDLGVLPTPAVAHASAVANVPAAMISASHNPFEDNGIKFFSAGGLKLPDAIEAQIEAQLDHLLGHRASDAADEVVVTGGGVGSLSASSAERESYEHALVASLEGRNLRGLNVVLDCANGAASEVAPSVFRRLGANVTVLHSMPNGTNINDNCGSTHLESLIAAVRTNRADVGLAFDGDADRMLAVDANGDVIDGDQLMAIAALDLRDRGMLVKNTVVVTVMTNLGFKIAMRQAGVQVAETKVGDRYVLEAIEEHGYVLGGEQSGHVIFRDRCTTGDGTLSGLALCDVMRRTGRTAADLASVVTRLPQVLRNVRGVDRSRLDTPAIWDAVRVEEQLLGDTGRVLLRPSGTEALVRVMVEAPTAETAEAVCARLCDVVLRELG